MELPQPPVPASASAAAVARARRICTLLVCDIADSTALVERLGDHRASDLIAQHDSLARDLVVRHHGREIDKTDGFLLVFERPSHAVAWALDYHRGLALLSESTGEKLQARVGIHMGDVVTWENAPDAVAHGAKPVEVEGLAKPTAARLAQLALPGQTLLSESAASLARRVEDEIESADSKGLRWLQHGRYRLKGLPEPVEVFEVGDAGAAPLRPPPNGRAGARAGRLRRGWVVALVSVILLGLVAGIGYWRSGQVPTTIPEKSVAVLPFANEGGQSDQQYFADGLSEDLITALSQFAGLKVISRNSAFQFRGSTESSVQIGKALGVAHLLEGNVQRVGGQVRITATLVNAVDGSVLWSHRYDKPYTELFALQDAITRAVAGALKAKLLTTPNAVVQSDRPPSGNTAAWVAYQQGKVYYALGTEAGDRQAVDAFHAAIRLDPAYAAAWAQLSRAWVVLSAQFLVGSERAQANATARAAAATALKLDPASALAHRAQASLLVSVDMDWRGAEAEARRAVQLAPHDAAAKFNLGTVLAAQGQILHAVDMTRQALASDPRHATWYFWLGSYLAALGRLDDAQHAIDTTIALQPAGAADHEQLAVIDILRGSSGEALAAAQAEPAGAWHDVALALALQVGSDRVAADAALQKLIADRADNSAYQIAEVYALRGDADDTFKWLERAWTNRDPGVGFLLVDPLILRYRDDPRFAAFCKKVGLPTTTDAVAMK